MIWLIELLMNRTLPSALPQFTPPVCRLRDMAEVIAGILQTKAEEI